MSQSLAGIKLAVIGGDARELILCEELTKKGAKVKVLGLPKEKLPNSVEVVDSIDEAIINVAALIFPMPGTNQEGKVKAVFSDKDIFLTKDILAKLPFHTPIFIGVARPFLHAWVQELKLKVCEIAEIDEVAILNSIPSAEGAIQIAMENQDITIHGSNSLVVGFGRCGKTLARMLHGLGANTYVTARKPSDLARIMEMGFKPVDYSELPHLISAMDTVYNTVPVQIITRQLLKKMNKATLIVDIASAPGGVDFNTAEEMGLNAILAPGLPGKVAPKTAGKILAQVLPPLIIKELSVPQSVTE